MEFQKFIVIFMTGLLLNPPNAGMNKHNYKKKNTMHQLIDKYEAMSQNGVICYFEKDIFNRLIEHYYKEDNLEKALEVINHAITQHSYSSEFYIKKAQILMATKCEIDALDCLELATVYAPSDLEIHILKAEAYSSIDEFGNAIKTLENIKYGLTKEDLCRVYIAEAIVQEKAEDYVKMFKALKKAILTDPSNQEALERIWFCVELSEMFKESIDLHKKVIDIDPYSSLAWYNLGHAYCCIEAFEESIEAYEYAFIINEKFEFAYRDCAEVCLQIENYKQALGFYEEVLERFEADCDLYTKVGFCYEQLNEYEKAKDFYLSAVKIDPYNDAVHYRLGICLTKEDKWHSAIGALKKAIELNHLAEEYHASLAEVYFELKDHDKACECFKMAVEIAPEQSRIWIQYASFLVDIDETYAALNVLDDADEFAGGVELKYSRVACLFSLGERQEALQLLGQVLEERYEMHKSLFAMMPALALDSDVLFMIETYSHF